MNVVLILILTPGEEKKEKSGKKAAPQAKSAHHRRRKRGAPAATKIPQGSNVKNRQVISPYTLFTDIIYYSTVFPTSKCKLRLLKLERIKDFLLMEEEFIRNQEILRPREEQNEVYPISSSNILVWSISFFSGR